MSIFGMSYGLMTDLVLKVNIETILSQDEMVFFIFARKCSKAADLTYKL